jgi:thiaminase/transcriptional activator TenA
MTLGTRAAHSDHLLASAQPVWDAILAHPFLRELRDSTLPVETFRFYLEQDWLYIQERIAEWAILAGRCPEPGIRRVLTQILDQVARLEPAAFHLKHAPALGIDFEHVTWDMNAANWAYTTHELAAV